MKKVIIVDDEKMIRVGIQRSISWENLGVDRVFLAPDARQALDIISNERPELMITDINMPDITGLELIKRVRAFVPDIRIIVLTGYDNFEYVRDSLRLAVNDFFLKPVDEDALVEAIRKQLLELDAVRQRKQELLKQTTDSYKQALIGIRKLLKRNRDTLSDTLPPAFCEKKARNIVLLIPSEPIHKKELEEYEALDVCNSFLNFSQGELAFLDESESIVLFINHSENGEEFTRKLRQIKSVLASEIGFDIQIIKGKTFYDTNDCADSFRDAKELYLYCKTGREKTVYGQSHLRQEELWNRYLADLTARISSQTLELKDALNICSCFEKKAKEQELSGDIMEYSGFQLASAFYYSKKMHFSSDLSNNQLEKFAGMIQNCDPEDIYLLLKKYICNLYQENGEKVPDFITKAKLIIAESLTDDISVNSIAAQLFISPGYLSRVFKASTGESCNNYIVRKRLEKAKNLLVQTDIPSGKIANMIGYKDSNYFSLAFKKSTGYSPQQYRQKYTDPHNQDTPCNYLAGKNISN